MKYFQLHTFTEHSENEVAKDYCSTLYHITYSKMQQRAIKDNEIMMNLECRHSALTI